MMNRLNPHRLDTPAAEHRRQGTHGAGPKRQVWPLLGSRGAIKPIIYKTFPLADAAAAHAELERASTMSARSC